MTRAVRDLVELCVLSIRRSPSSARQSRCAVTRCWEFRKKKKNVSVDTRSTASAGTIRVDLGVVDTWTLHTRNRRGERGEKWATTVNMRHLVPQFPRTESIFARHRGVNEVEVDRGLSYLLQISAYGVARVTMSMTTAKKKRRMAGSSATMRVARDPRLLGNSASCRRGNSSSST